MAAVERQWRGHFFLGNSLDPGPVLRAHFLLGDHIFKERRRRRLFLRRTPGRRDAAVRNVAGVVSSLKYGCPEDGPADGGAYEDKDYRRDAFDHGCAPLHWFRVRHEFERLEH